MAAVQDDDAASVGGQGTGSGDTLSLMMPVATASYPTPADGVAVKWDTAKARALFAAIKADSPLDEALAGTQG